MTQTITLPEFSLVFLIGVSGSGKTTFGQRHFLPTEVISSDVCRGLVADDENDQDATQDAFDILYYIAGKRLAQKRLTVLDATHVQPDARKRGIRLAREYNCLPVAIVLRPPEAVCQARNSARPDRQFGPHVIKNQSRQLKQALRNLKREGFRHIYILDSEEKINTATIERSKLWCDKREETGPFDIIGDIHGCCDELEILLDKLGYQSEGEGYQHPEGRKVVFLGDLVDRGPRVLDSLKLAMTMVEAGQALCVPGNHEAKLIKKLQGKNVKLKHGLEQTMAEIEALSSEAQATWMPRYEAFMDSLISHYVLDEGKLVVAHAGLKEAYQGRASGRVRQFALFGETTGEIDEFGLPVRHNWAAEYRGDAMVVYGHTPVPEPEWLNNTINIDNGCVFGGKLTALRYPERELVSVPAAKVYCDPIKPLGYDASDPRSAQQQHDDILDLADVTGKRIVHTPLRHKIIIREENSIAALEVMSRFAANPRWLLYLPPTMSPCETSDQPDYLEYPTEAFGYYRRQGVQQLICQEKHMGSRAVVVLCRTPKTALSRFGVQDEAWGCCYTRTGRPFFKDHDLEQAFLSALVTAAEKTGIWDELKTDWLLLDCELMPWSVKAQELIQQQYAAVGCAAKQALSLAIQALEQAQNRGIDVAYLLSRQQTRQTLIDQYRQVYPRYCWPVEGLNDLKLAPFHLLASEGQNHSDKPHVWHMDILGRFCTGDPKLLHQTAYRLVDFADPDSETAAENWWLELTEKDGEGMVIKPQAFIAQGKRGYVQPAIKCRGREYLRLIYGPEYTLPEHLKRLKQRGLSAKRSMAAREFALGLEGINRFVKREPLRRIHTCVMGVLALESEPVDPRL